MIKSLLAGDEGKALEFKENCRPLYKIVQTAVAFANTAGGTIVIGVQDKTKGVIGLTDTLKDEEGLANSFADRIRPLLIPEIQIHAWRDKELIVVSVPHAIGPYYIKSEGPEKGVYIRLGSTNRRAGPEIISEIHRLARNTFFDEQPCTEISSEGIDFRAASEFFSAVSRQLTSPRRRSLGLVVNIHLPLFALYPVAPHAGAWIETKQLGVHYTHISVAPRAGACVIKVSGLDI